MTGSTDEMDRDRAAILAPVHLGDGAYITFDGYGYMLTANHHDASIASDRVYLDGPPVIDALQRYFSDLQEKIAAYSNKHQQPDGE